MALSNASQMQQTYKLPMLPGNTCGEELLRRNYRKTQALSGTGEHSLKMKDVPIDFDSCNVSKTAAVGLGSTGGKNATMSQTGGSTMSMTNHPIDRQVLRFYGHYAEGVSESALEKSRVRKITLCYFLEDDTISVSEPKQDNSGIAFQGAMVKRHQIAKPDGSGRIGYRDLSVGSSISFYGRTFYLTDCDHFTREYMAAMGLNQAEPIEAPADQYMETRNKPKTKSGLDSMATALNASGMKVKLSAGEVRATKQFLSNDRQVLRFDAVWNDTKALYGEKHFFTLYYFLADDTIEVVEKDATNSGRDPFPSFVRRQKMMKPRSGTTKFENLSASLATRGDELKGNNYTDADLRIGAEVVVFGRVLMLYDCDKFTQTHLREKHGVTEHKPIEVHDPPKPPVKREPPPYNGFGDETDSLASWRSLDMKPPKRDPTNFLKFGDGSVKYSLKLCNGVPNDEVRKFVLTCFLADETIAIFEPVQRNSGVVGGKFLQRTKVTNPETGKPFIAKDFYVGKKVTVNGFPFAVQATDERSLTFMEQHSSDFDMSNINRVVKKIQAMLLSAQTDLLGIFSKADADSNGVLDYKELAGLFGRVGLPVCEQEVLTLLRYFDRNGDNALTYQELAGRLLGPEDTPNSDPRTWQEIHAEMTAEASANLSVQDRVDHHSRAIEATTAAYAARTFLEAYQNRRQLFHSEFKFVTDYAVDNKIGEPEFRKVVTEKLNLGFSPEQVNSLSHKLFPERQRRVYFDEFIRLMNNNSNFDHNLSQIRSRRE